MKKSYSELNAEISERLNLDKSYDLQCRKFLAAGQSDASFYSVAGFLDDKIAERLLEFAVNAASPKEALYNIPHHDVTVTDDISDIIDAILIGKAVLLVDGFSSAAVIDAKSYPLRSVGEPENDRVLRGPRDGFGESLVRNTALIRRRLRSPKLIMERITVGRESRLDIALCHVKGRADDRFVAQMKKKLNSIDIQSLNMSQESLAECLIRRGWYNPFPKLRYTERPDAAAAMLEEGSVLIVSDNSPQVLVLPTGILDFLQQTDDFYFPPLIGSYLRITRMIIFLLSLVLTPIWYLLVRTPEHLPSWLEFIEISQPAAVPLILQLLLAEFMIDGLKLASLNTPNMLSNSLSVVGGLILGDYAVQAGWFAPQTILYMAIVAIASFTQQSYELGYAFKFIRIILLILVHLFGLSGLLGGIAATTVIIALNKTVAGSRSYLYPLIPFNGGALLRMFIRPRLKNRK